MRLTRRGFLKGSAAGGALLALPCVARARNSGASYAVAVLGDTHFDEARDPDGVASYDVTQSKYHANWDSSESNAATHYNEFLRNGEMWNERCPRLVAASAALAASSPTRFILQIGDLVQGDCGNSETHVQMLRDGISALRGGFPSGLPFLTVLGNHDVRGTGARNAYLNFAQPFMGDEIAGLSGAAQGATKYPVFSFRLDADLWVFCDFETVNMNPVCDAIDANPSARHVFLVTHGPFTTCAACTSASNARWRLAGRSGSEATRPRLYETLSRRHAIVLSGHTHTTDYYWHRNEYGGFAEMTVNSVWRSEDLATAAPIHDKVEDYSAPLANADYRNEIAYFRPGLRRYFHNNGAGHYRLNVSDDEVTMAFYPGAATTPGRIFTLKKDSGSRTGWVDESARASETTGVWSQVVDYDSDTGRASIAGERTFTPATPSAGRHVTMTVKMQFTDMANAVDAPEGVQAAVQLGANGSFQVWTTHGGVKRWLDVSAEGVVPRAGVECTFRFRIDYGTRRYSVSVQTANGGWAPLGLDGDTSFALASDARRLSAVRFVGGGSFKSLTGDYDRGLGMVIR